MALKAARVVLAHPFMAHNVWELQMWNTFIEYIWDIIALSGFLFLIILIIVRVYRKSRHQRSITTRASSVSPTTARRSLGRSSASLHARPSASTQHRRFAACATRIERTSRHIVRGMVSRTETTGGLFASSSDIAGRADRRFLWPLKRRSSAKTRQPPSAAEDHRLAALGLDDRADRGDGETTGTLTLSIPVVLYVADHSVHAPDLRSLIRTWTGRFNGC